MAGVGVYAVHMDSVVSASTELSHRGVSPL